MSKNKKSGNLKGEKALVKLLQKVENGDFENAEQVKEFIRSMKDKSLDDLPESTTDIGRSQD